MTTHNEGKVGHTPGPWLVAESNNDMTCVYTEETNIALLVHKADAALIAASPELLEACKELLKLGVECSEWDNCIHCRAKQAISKATGGK